MKISNYNGLDLQPVVNGVIVRKSFGSNREGNYCEELAVFNDEKELAQWIVDHFTGKHEVITGAHLCED